MTITSFYYLAFILVGAIIYYLIPKSWQWIELLIMSVAFFCLATSPVTILYLVGSMLVAYIATNYLDSKKARKGKGKKAAVAYVAIAIILNILVWLVVKGDSLLVTASLVFRKVIPVLPAFNGFSFIGALGMGYYTLQVIGYILDCSWGTIKPQKNPLKLFLFVCFFPQLTSGPISRYTQLESLYEKHEFSYKNLTFGFQRIAWGLFKKLVIANRVATIVDGVWGNLSTLDAKDYWIALLLYPIQMYADFSGCMDIVIGTAEIFGISLPENFKNPFFSKTSQEFWQRWHITLGLWAKSYVLYPILKSNFMVNLSKASKKRFGKHYGKLIATSVGMFFLWMVMGIWHGSAKYIIGVSLWYWIIMILGELLSPVFKKINVLLRVPVESFSWRLFQSVRTFMIYAVGAIFFRASCMSEAVNFIKVVFSELFRGKFYIGFSAQLAHVFGFGTTHQDLNIIYLGVILILVVDVLREKFGYARNWVSKQMWLFRWSVWILLIFSIIILGKYGDGFYETTFIYFDF